MSVFFASRAVRVVALMGVEASFAATFAILTANALGPSDRGVIVIFATVSSFLMLVGSWGAATGGRMLLSQQAPDYPPRRHLEVTLRLSSAHVITMISVGWLLLVVTHAWRGWVVAVIFAAYGVGMIVVYLMREALHGIGLHTAASFGGVLLNAVLVGGFFVVGTLGKISVTSVSALLLVSAVGAASFLTAHLVRASKDKPSVAYRSLKALLVLSAPALLASVGQALTIRGDRLVLGALASTEDVGIYGTAATFAELMWLIPMGVGQVVFRHAALGQFERVRRLQVFTLVAMVVLGSLAAIIARPAVSILLGPEYADSVPLIWMLLVAGLPMGLYHLNAPILNGSGDLRGPAIASGFSALVLFLVCFATIPTFGAVGAAVGSFVAYSLMASVAVVRSRRVMRLRAATSATPDTSDLQDR